MRLLGVSAVGNQINRPGRYRRPAITTRKAGSVGYVGRLCYDKAVYALCVQQKPNSLDSVFYNFIGHSAGIIPAATAGAIENKSLERLKV